MSANELPPRAALLQMMTGYWLSQSVYAAAKLGLADLLRDGPQTAEQMATACQAHPTALYRLLRALASVGVFMEVEDGRFALTPTAEFLRSDHPGSMRSLAMMYAEEQYQAWGNVLWSIQTGTPAFDHHFGTSYFHYLAEHPTSAATFNAAMTGWSNQVASAVAEAYDFADSGVVVDVGGSYGTLLIAILTAHPHLRGILFDLPHVVASAESVLRTAGVADRCQAVGGDFFEKLPASDTYILAQILHDWDDDQSRAILQNCRAAMAPSGRILIVELVIPPGNEPFLGKLLDLHMLVLLTGRERTEAEYRDLLASAGLQLTRIIPTHSGASVIEATRVS